MYVYAFQKEVGEGQNNGDGKEINWVEDFNKTGANNPISILDPTMR